MIDTQLTGAQARILREAEAACVYDATGSRVAACQRLLEAGLMRLVTWRRYKVTAAGRRWIEYEEKR